MYNKPVAIIDIDTTIANNEHRAVLLQKHCATCNLPVGSEHRAVCMSCGGTSWHTPQNLWDEFLRTDLMAKDTPQPHALDVLNQMRGKGWCLVFLTGRNEKHRPVTEDWLRRHMGFTHETLLMRPMTATGTPASKMKEQMFLAFRKEHYLQDNTFLFFEDDRFVLGTWQRYGMVFLCPQAWEYMNPVVLERSIEPSWNR